jgi:hypothetical protein
LRYLGLFLTGAALALTLACGGSTAGASVSTTSATKLVYTDPVSNPSGWQLVNDGLSTDRKIILDLMAPTNAIGEGMSMILTTTSSEASWSHLPKAANHRYAVNAYPNPVVNVATVHGPDLRIVVAQSLGTPAVIYGSAPVLQVSLNLASGAVTGAIPVTVTDAGHLGLGNPATPAVITVDVGSLEAQ